MSGARDRIVQSAEKNLSRGRLDQALQDYLRLLAENSNDAFALNKAGDLCVRMGRPADAIEHFVRIAELYSADGFFLKAIAIFKKINKIDPTRLDIYERLAELYTRQGLTQDARSHYHTLAEQWLKKNDLKGAIAAYSKIVALDPGDLRVQTRLADLHRVAGEIGQAVARYDAIGGLLQRRGAHEEATTFFRKALELDPNDSGARIQIIRSYLASNDLTSAIAALNAGPRTAETRVLLGEAHLASGEASAAAAAAEDALELEPDNESARILLGRIRLDEGSPDRAFEAVSPLVDRAIEAEDFAGAASHLAPILDAHPEHRASRERLAEVRERAGDAASSITMRLALAGEAEARGDIAAASEHYRRILSVDPVHAEASARLVKIAPPPSPPAAPPTPPPRESARADDTQAALEEAEVLARYGLKDRAIQRLHALAKRNPEALAARERLVELMVELGNPGAPREAEALAGAYRRQGRESLAVALYARLGLSGGSSRPPAAPEVVFDEFEIELPASQPRSASERAPFDAFAGLPESSPAPISTSRGEGRPSSGVRLTPHGPSDTGFGVLAPELGSLIGEKMQRAAAESPRRESPMARPRAVDDENLFADEQQFFNLAEELEKELIEEVTPPVAPILGETQGEASLQDLFREFRKGVEQQLSAEDYETHYNLGIAYKEMGLLDEAIGEFQLASKAPALTVECCSLLGLCFLEKGMPQLAIKWYAKGLATPGIRESETAGLLYDLARVYQDSGDMNLAYKTFLEVYGINTNYRDVVERVRDLEEARKNSRESFH
ncbi:MAG TPA: tetratricopeptide repeat protein [Thermoanaerobaculia bacterium]|nr:tetratricopeptide repeat protein [Thermoanaerobaculia bacterium]